MNKKVTLKHPLLVQKPFEKLSKPQKCKVPQNNGIDIPAASLIVVKSESRRFLCRLYYLSEVYDDKRTAYIDDAVELHPTGAGEIKWIQELEFVDSSAEFNEIKINLQLNVSEINLDVIKQPEDLIKLTKSIVKHFQFSADCEISCNRNGISRIFVVETDVDGFGSITEDIKIVINKITVDSHTSLGRKKLGGLQKPEDTLRNLIETNLNFLKNRERFSFKPAHQVLLIGPVGTGKTSLVHHVVNSLDCVLLEISGDVFQPLPGETERGLEEKFERIKGISRIIGGGNHIVVLLIENLEIFCPIFNAKMKENSHSSRISSMIASKLEEISENSTPTIVIGTTSKLESLNPSLKRNKCEIVIDMPNENQREDILSLLSEQFSAGFSDKLLKFVAQSTPGFVGADLEVLCQFVSRHLINENLEFTEENLHKAFELAMKSITASVIRENLGLVTRSSMKLNSIGGMEKLKKSLITSVLGPLRHPEKFHRLGLRSPSGILLYGPSGCAKTTIVKCLAGEAKMTLVCYFKRYLISFADYFFLDFSFISGNLFALRRRSRKIYRETFQHGENERANDFILRRNRYNCWQSKCKWRRKRCSYENFIDFADGN
jgi:SpoVK/Ycf46/Vps4 family AAA+-type ATPase